MAEGQGSTGLHRRCCIGSIAKGRGLRLVACRQRSPGALCVHRSKSIHGSIGVVDGVGVVRNVNGFSLPLVGKLAPCLGGRLMDGRGQDSGSRRIPIIGVAGVKLSREFVGPARGRPAAGIGAIWAVAEGGLGLGSGGVTALSSTTPVGHGYRTSMPYPQRIGGVGAGTQCSRTAAWPHPTCRLGRLYQRTRRLASALLEHFPHGQMP